MNDLKTQSFQPTWQSKSTYMIGIMVREAYERFGYDNTLLLPVKDSQVIPGWSEADLERSHSAECQQELNRADIAVVCGTPSRGLCATRFSDQATMDAFLESNPAIRQTLKTSSRHGTYLWLRVTGDFCPASCQFPGLHWLSEGASVVLKREPCSRWRLDKDGKPLALDFDQIVWPAEATRAFKVEAIGHQYQFTVADRKGRKMVNDNFIATVFALDNRIFYNPARQQFFSDAGQSAKLYPEMVKRSLLQFLARFAETFSKRGCWLDTSLKHADRLLELLKVICVQAPAEEDVAMEKFVEAQLALVAGRDVTVAETYSSYVEYCSRQNLPVFARSQFLNRIPRVVKQRFGIGKNHAIKRNSRCVRGFTGLEIRSRCPDVGATDVTDAMDGGVCQN
jgi:hypothetical protein